MSFKVGNHGKKFEFSLPINQRRVVLLKKKPDVKNLNWSRLLTSTDAGKL
jgi:hypothetical protein